MPPALPLSDEEDYASSEDSDFAPDSAAQTAPGDDVEESSDEEDSDAEPTITTATTKGKEKEKGKQPAKRKRGEDEAEDAGFENSGDEAIIEKGLKRRRRKGKKGEEDEDEGGEGGLVKTRSMRAQEKVEKKPLASAATSTLDVDSLWASMISGNPIPSPSSSAANPKSNPITSPGGENLSRSLSPITSRQTARSPSTTLADGPESMIMIKRTYNFAGKVHTEQKLVSRNSAEAKLFLASQPLPSTSTTAIEPEPESDSPFLKPKRPVKKARRSIFEPTTIDLPVRTDLHFGIRKDADGKLSVGVTGKEKKLNTVEKSAMDWAGFVDKEGIKDELDAAGKSKGAYKSRQEFLARVEGKKEEESRRARGLPV